MVNCSVPHAEIILGYYHSEFRKNCGQSYGRDAYIVIAEIWTNEKNIRGDARIVIHLCKINLETAILVLKMIEI